MMSGTLEVRMEQAGAFRVFYLAHQRDVLRYVERRVADQAVAEEVTADAFAVA
jgi:DNA-directed RNA polymerase specialized sigma24 family protein